MKDILISDLPDYLKDKALREQERQGNIRNENLSVLTDKSGGNFNWFYESEDGGEFWLENIFVNWKRDFIYKWSNGKQLTRFQIFKYRLSKYFK